MKRTAVARLIGEEALECAVAELIGKEALECAVAKLIGMKAMKWSKLDSSELER